MTKALFITIFILGLLFSNASQIPAWLLGAGKPDSKKVPHWKAYGIIAAIIWLILLILANTIL